MILGVSACCPRFTACTMIAQRSTVVICWLQLVQTINVGTNDCRENRWVQMSTVRIYDSTRTNDYSENIWIQWEQMITTRRDDYSENIWLQWEHMITVRKDDYINNRSLLFSLSLSVGTVIICSHCNYLNHSTHLFSWYSSGLIVIICSL